jgi:hypothetical protein
LNALERDPPKQEQCGGGYLRAAKPNEHFYTDCWLQPAQAPQSEGRQQGAPSQEADMTEADLFRQYAKDAMRSSSQSTNENEKRDLLDLACTWAQAALMSQRVFGSSFVSSPRDIAEAISPTRQVGVR